MQYFFAENSYDYTDFSLARTFFNVKVTDNLSLIKGQERKEKEVEENRFVIGQFEHRTFEFCTAFR